MHNIKKDQIVDLFTYKKKIGELHKVIEEFNNELSQIDSSLTLKGE